MQTQGTPTLLRLRYPIRIWSKFCGGFGLRLLSPKLAHDCENILMIVDENARFQGDRNCFYTQVLTIDTHGLEPCSHVKKVSVIS